MRQLIGCIAGFGSQADGRNSVSCLQLVLLLLQRLFVNVCSCWVFGSQHDRCLCGLLCIVLLLIGKCCDMNLFAIWVHVVYCQRMAINVCSGSGQSK